MGKREIVGFAKILRQTACKSKSKGRPRARYSIRARVLTKIYLADFFGAIRFLRFAAFALYVLNLSPQALILELKFYKFCLVNLSKTVLLNPTLKFCFRLNEIYLNLGKNAYKYKPPLNLLGALLRLNLLGNGASGLKHRTIYRSRSEFAC